MNILEILFKAGVSFTSDIIPFKFSIFASSSYS